MCDLTLESVKALESLDARLLSSVDYLDSQLSQQQGHVKGCLVLLKKNYWCLLFLLLKYCSQLPRLEFTWEALLFSDVYQCVLLFQVSHSKWKTLCCMKNSGKGTIPSSTKEDARAPSNLLPFIALINANVQKLQTQSVLSLCLFCWLVGKLGWQLISNCMDTVVW